jgi:tRNA (guanine-N7-)-methyltransferase
MANRGVIRIKVWFLSRQETMARILKEYPGVGMKVEELEGRIDFGWVFGRGGPVHIEIGCGKGTFLVNQGRVQPAVNFIGIERASKYYRYAVDRIGRWGLTNVRIARTDAASFVANFVADGSIDCFHIYFPDPWPKRRHHRRRFFCSANLQQLLRCLRAGGQVRVATDHLEYFQVIRELATAEGGKLEEIEFFPAAGAQIGEWVGTNFERKYLKENRPIYTIAVKKLV